jgi:hypothetical protein
VTTAITNLDIHDIARTCHTYGVERYVLVHPVQAQRELATRVVEHWTTGSGARRIPDRRPAMERVQIEESLEAARASWDPAAELWVTSAQSMQDSVEHSEARTLLSDEGVPVLLVLGTGWGLAPQVTESAALRLAPIRSPRSDGYNHLSVRAAAAILLDRLVGAA